MHAVFMKNYTIQKRGGGDRIKFIPISLLRLHHNNCVMFKLIITIADKMM